MIEIKQYTPDKEKIWDTFIYNESRNGTILHTRSFLNYHKDRFIDNSLMLYKGGSCLIALLPACAIEENGKKILYSHLGSTFGGLVVADNQYTISTLIELIEALEEYCKANGFAKIIMKNTSDIFSKGNNDLISFLLDSYGFDHYEELSMGIDFRTMKTDVVANMKGKTRNEYRSSFKNNLTLKRLETNDEIKDFYNILVESLKKYDTKPVHTLGELYALNEINLKGRVEFYGVMFEDKMIAGGMVFLFDRVFHTQYLAALPDYLYLKPMVFMDGSLIEEAHKRNYDFFSFGISTEDHGKYLNQNLAKYKEGFGCECYLNKTFYKEY